MKRGLFNNKGQVTIFIIVAILVVAIAVAVYFLFPNLISNIRGGASVSPTEYIDDCMREKVLDTIDIASLQGGLYNVSEAESYSYLGYRVKYHCYTNQYYETCTVQYPLLISRFESEVKKEIEDSVDICFANLVDSYEEKGYSTYLESINETSVEISPEKLFVEYGKKFEITKGETDTYEDFYTLIESNLFQILSVAVSITRWEAEYGDAPHSIYMDWYPNLKIEKKLQLDGTTIYIIKDRATDEVFQFASRSAVLPSGY